MSVALLLVVISLSVVLVRVAAVALELTGIPWDRAKFHALSAFTNTGYPTPRSAEICEHPVRRRIASYLIILGNAGLITTVATLASSLMTADPWRSAINLGAVVLGIGSLVWIMRRPWLGRRLKPWAQRVLRARYAVDAEVQATQLLHLGENLALIRVPVDAKICEGCRTLAEFEASRPGARVLGVERPEGFVAAPQGQETLSIGDTLVVYGSIDAFEARSSSAPP
jgi:hypothetical protein